MMGYRSRSAATIANEHVTGFDNAHNIALFGPLVVVQLDLFGE